MSSWYRGDLVTLFAMRDYGDGPEYIIETLDLSADMGDDVVAFEVVENLQDAWAEFDRQKVL